MADDSPRVRAAVARQRLPVALTSFDPWSLSVPSVLRNLAWVVAAAAAAAIVWRVQIANRAPLTWDESVRVDAGSALASAIRSADLIGIWQWIHSQFYYPFFEPTLHGLTLIATNDPLVAAWTPSLIAYAVAGLLAARLALDLGAGSIGAVGAALLTWTVPIAARNAAGAFTEPIGACLLLLLLILLVRAERDDSIRIPVAAGLVAALMFFEKYDYGLLALGTISVSGIAAAAFGTKRSERLERYGLILAIAVGFISAWLAVNTTRKIAIFTHTIVGAHTPSSATAIDFTYYARALFANGEVGLSTLIAAGLSLAVISAIAQARRREMRPPVICLILWYALYSTAQPHVGRFVGPIMPLVAVFGGLAIGQLIAATKFESLRLRRIALALAFVAFGWQLVAQASAGATGLSAQYWFVVPNPSATDAVSFASGHLSDRGPVLMLGQTAEFSSYALHLAWSQRLDHQAPPVNFLGETGQPVTQQSLIAAINGYHAGQVVGVDIRPGSSFDTLDYRTTFPSQPQYLALAYQLESSGALIRQATLSLEGGRLHIIVWDYRSP